jgi:hypothetical protein
MTADSPFRADNTPVVDHFGLWSHNGRFDCIG